MRMVPDLGLPVSNKASLLPEGHWNLPACPGRAGPSRWSGLLGALTAGCSCARPWPRVMPATGSAAAASRGPAAGGGRAPASGSSLNLKVLRTVAGPPAGPGPGAGRTLGGAGPGHQAACRGAK